MDHFKMIGKFVKLYLPGSSRFLYGTKLKVIGIDAEQQKLLVEDLKKDKIKIHVSYFRYLNNKKVKL